MVSRSDPKPTYYYSTAYKVLRPIAVMSDRSMIEFFMDKIVSVKTLPSKEWLLPKKIRYIEYETTAADTIYDSIARECENGMNPYTSVNCTAAYMAKHFRNSRSIIKDRAMCKTVCDVYSKIFADVTEIFHGSEASVALVDRTMRSKFVKTSDTSPNVNWSNLTTIKTIILQASACMQHPDGFNALISNHIQPEIRNIANAFSLFANFEKVLYRSSGGHNYLSHLYFSKKKVIKFKPFEDIEKNFEVTIPDIVSTDVHVYKILGNTIVRIGSKAFILSLDDVLAACKMVRSYFNLIVYFAIRKQSSGCLLSTVFDAFASMFTHLTERIIARKYYGDTLRAFNLYNMYLFQKLDEVKAEIGFKERGDALLKEINALDGRFNELAEKVKKLALNDYDETNVFFLYHAVIGDDAGVDDLINKLKKAPSKVKETAYSPDYFNDMIQFLKSYTLAKYMQINRTIPNTGGAPIDDSIVWVKKCLKGGFKMPASVDIGKTWIENHFTFNEYIRFWNLEAADVTFILNKPEAYLKHTEVLAPEFSNELLYTMKYGSVLDPATKVKPPQTLDNLYKGVKRATTVFVAAAKNENAKPSWKKRITFSADNEFRKTQAMFDKNIHSALSMLPGGVLGLGHRDAEKKFAHICERTILDGNTLNTSQDVDGWSESQERSKFFAFAEFVIQMTDKKDAINIKEWWAAIKVCFNKLGTSFNIDMPDGGFQGMPGRQDTLEHAGLLLYFVYRMKKEGKLPEDMRVLHNTCIDDCVASFITGSRDLNPLEIFKMMAEHYAKLGYKLDYNKSLISYIKAIFCSRRFIRGIEISSEMKTFLKIGVSYDTSFHSPENIVSDYLSGALGALNAGGIALDTYFGALFAGLCTLSMYVPAVLTIPPDRAAVYCMICKDDLGWGVPDIIQWSTKDIIDLRTRSNCIFQSAAECVSIGYSQVGITDSQASIWASIKCNEWDHISAMSFIMDPYRAVRSGPARFENILINTIKPYIKQYVTNDEWKNMIEIEENEELHRIITMLCNEADLDATIINALSQSFPWTFSKMMQNKAYASTVVAQSIPQSIRFSLRRRCNYMGTYYIMYLERFVISYDHPMTCHDLGQINPHEFTMSERDAFFAKNNFHVFNHTFADPISSFTQISKDFKSHLAYTIADFKTLRNLPNGDSDVRTIRGKKGLYVPPKSANVLEYTSKRFDDWDPVTKKIIAGLVVLGVAEDEGHEVSGLRKLFISLWDIYGSADTNSPIIASTRGSSKRLASNPGSITHPLFMHRNISQSVIVNLSSAIAALPASGHMHDVLGSITAMRACTVLVASILLKKNIASFKIDIGLRPDMVIHRTHTKMNTQFIVPYIYMAIDNSSTPWGFAQIHKDLADRIRILTMPAVSAKYITAMMCEKKFNYEKTMIDCRKYIESIGETKMFLEDVIYPTELKPRGNIVAASGATIVDPYALMVKGPMENPKNVGDSIYSSKRGAKFKVLTSSVPVVANAKTLVNVIRTSLIYAFQQVKISDIASVAMKEYENMEKIRDAIINDSVWIRVLDSAATIFKEEDFALMWHNAFAKMGAPGFRCDGVPTLVQIKSFVGQHISEMAELVLPEYARITGTKKSDFNKRSMLVIVAADADRINRRKRLAALINAKKSYITQLKIRIKDIEENTIKHWSDATAIEKGISPSIRLTHLRIKLLVTRCIDYTDELEINVPEVIRRFVKNMNKVQHSINKRLHLKDTIYDCSPDIKEIDDIYKAFDNVEKHLDGKSEVHGFNADKGKYEFRDMMSWYKHDISREKNTFYAVTPGHIKSRHSHTVTAPLMHISTDVDEHKVHDIAEMIIAEDAEYASDENVLNSSGSEEDDITRTVKEKEKQEIEPEIKYKVAETTMDEVVLPMKTTRNWISADEFEKEPVTVKVIPIAPKVEHVHKPATQISEVTPKQKDLMTVLINDLITVSRLQAITGSSSTSRAFLYKCVNVFSLSDADIQSKFGNVTATAQMASAEWEDDWFTLLDEIGDDDDVAED